MMACPWVTRSSHVCRMKRVWLLCVSNGVTPAPEKGGVGVGFEVFGLRLFVQQRHYATPQTNLLVST